MPSRIRIFNWIEAPAVPALPLTLFENLNTINDDAVVVYSVVVYAVVVNAVVVEIVEIAVAAV